MPERRARGDPTGWNPNGPTPDLGGPRDEKISFGTHRVCSNCKGKTTKRGETCRACMGSGFERLRPIAGG